MLKCIVRMKGRKDHASDIKNAKLSRQRVSLARTERKVLSITDKSGNSSPERSNAQAATVVARLQYSVEE